MPANRRRSRGGSGVLGWARDIRLSLGRDPDQRMASRGEGGGDEETRTPDPLLAKEMLCQLSYVPVLCALREVVGAPGLEPGTSALSGPRSNQLSYAPWLAGIPGQAGHSRTITLEEWQEQGIRTYPVTVSHHVAVRPPACAGAPHMARDANDRGDQPGSHQRQDRTVMVLTRISLERR